MALNYMDDKKKNNIPQSSSEIKEALKSDVVKAGQETGKKIVKVTESNTDMVYNFNNIGAEIVQDLKQPDTQKNIDKFLSAMDDPKNNFEDPTGKTVVQNVIELVKSGNWKEALQVGYDFLMAVFGGRIDSAGKSFFWFSEDTTLTNFITTLDNKTPQELQSQISTLQERLQREGGTKKKLGLSYALSQIKARLDKFNPSLQSLLESKTETQDKNIALMAQHCNPGDIIVVNKSEQQHGDLLLTELKEKDIKASHVMMVQEVNRENGTITIIHSTMNKLSQPGEKGVEQKIDFGTYARQFGGLAVAVLEPPVDGIYRKEYINNVLSKDGKGYDSFSAMSEGILGSNMFGSNDKYNCGELIAQSFVPPKTWSHPVQFLKELKPSYVTVAGKSIGIP